MATFSNTLGNSHCSGAGAGTHMGTEVRRLASVHKEDVLVVFMVDMLVTADCA